jgi:hypothetical protein
MTVERRLARHLPPILNIDFLNWTLLPASGIVNSLRNLLCMQPLRSCFCFASLVCCPANLLTSLFFSKTEPALFPLRARSVLATLTTGDSIKSLRKFASTAVLTLGALSLMPSTASAQTANGSFILSHDAHWQELAEAIVLSDKVKGDVRPPDPS